MYYVAIGEACCRHSVLTTLTSSVQVMCVLLLYRRNYAFSATQTHHHAPNAQLWTRHHANPAYWTGTRWNVRLEYVQCPRVAGRHCDPCQQDQETGTVVRFFIHPSPPSGPLFLMPFLTYFFLVDWDHKKIMISAAHACYTVGPLSENTVNIVCISKFAANVCLRHPVVVTCCYISSFSPDLPPTSPYLVWKAR